MSESTTDIRSVPEQLSQLRYNCSHAIALSRGERQLTYDELDCRAGQFAAYLTQLGIAPGGAVAICMDRSFDWIIAALGIMRVGAAYVPLDSAWPDTRLRFAVEDSGAGALVAREALLDRLKVSALGIDLCRDAAAIAAAKEAPLRPIDPESLAYVIYTSGSTGVPKGVEITHNNLCHLIRWHRNAFSVTSQDRAGHLAGLGFDAAVWEVWPNLCAGATVCLADETVRSSPDLITKWMIRERVTIAFVPTIHAAPMMAMEWPATTELRLLLTGGDVLRHAPAVPLPFDVVNNYGPTECTVVATSTVITPGSDGLPPIGRPISGASVYLLDENGRPVPEGSAGEIYVAGNGVGRGYRNLPDSTCRNFLPDHFSATAGARMYRTGDRGVRRSDGQIEFRGRLDRQIKIRGQRVELDEIDSILTAHPSVDFAKAIAKVSPEGESQLVAYVLPKKNALAPTTNELQKHVLNSLPDHMVPPIFVRLNDLPLSPNGKLDLKLLPQPTNANLLQSRAAKEFASPIEEKLLNIVRELLKNDAVVAADNFFLAGGHSLLGMQLVIKVQTAFGVELTLRQLFEAPSVESLAVVIQTALRGQRLAEIWKELLERNHFGLDDDFSSLGGGPALVAALQERIAKEFGLFISISELLQNSTVRRQAELTLRAATAEPVLPPGVFGLHVDGKRHRIFWVHTLNVSLAKELGEDQPFFFVTLTANDLMGLGEKPTLQNIAACLVGKILATQSKGPYNIGGVCIGSILAYEMASQLRAAGHEVSLLLLLDAPSQPYLRSCNSLPAQLNHPRHFVRRLAQVGIKQSLVNFCKRPLKYFPLSVRTKYAGERTVAHELIEVAAFAYEPKKYDGNVLLIQADERDPYLNFLPGWQGVIPHDLHTRFVDGRHRELITPENVRDIADIINSHLPSAPERVCECLSLPVHLEFGEQETKKPNNCSFLNNP